MSNNLKRYRAEAKLSQAGLARRSGVSVQTVSSLEQTGSTPGQDIAGKLSAALGRVPDQVFPQLHMPHPGANRFRQLQHVHPKPTAALTETERLMIQDVLPLMPPALFAATVGAPWKTVEEVILGFVALVRKAAGGTWEWDVKGRRKAAREAVGSSAKAAAAASKQE